MSLLQTIALLGSLVASVAAHGHVSGIVAAGKFYEGYDPSFQYMDPPPIVVGWSVPDDLSNGFIDPNNYTTENIICHLAATPAGASAKIAAGDIVELQWTPWPSSHHGPVLDYLAKCPGSCTDVDKTTLEFFKIDEGGLVNENVVPGTWATDQLIANNNSWTVTIPKSIASGNYVLRHEIIALHAAEEADGAQNYPQCVNLEITGSGSEEPAGTLGEKLYTPKEPGILIDIYTSLSTYIIPGPSLISGAVSMKQTEVKITATAPVASGKSTAYGASPTADTSSSVAMSMSSSTAAAASTSAAPSTSTPTSTTTKPKSTTKATSKAKPTTTAESTAKPTTTATSKAKPTTKATSKAKPSSYKHQHQHHKTSKTSKPTSNTTPSSTEVSPVSASSISCKQTITITVTHTSATSIAAASASESASAITAPAPYSALSSLVSALPSGALSKTAPVSPTSTGGAASPTGGSGGSSGGMPPSMAPPKGTTLKELLEWLAYMMEHIFRKEAKHGRDFGGR